MFGGCCVIQMKRLRQNELADVRKELAAQHFNEMRHLRMTLQVWLGVLCVI